MRKKVLWFTISIISVLTSILIHECGHGISNLLIGQPVSTGFNRVGNAYMFPGDVGFRDNLNLSAGDLIDFGVLSTWFLAILFTILYVTLKHKNHFTEKIYLSLAIANSSLRLIPALWSTFAILSGSEHMEDEVGIGTVWASKTGIAIMEYIPLVFSIVISVVCLSIIIIKMKRKRGQTIPMLSIFTLSYVSAMILASFLDQYIRINWVVN